MNAYALSQEEFNLLLSVIQKTRSEERVEALTKLHSLCSYTEIRDYDWAVSETLNLYDILIRTIGAEWTRDIEGPINKTESLCLAIWSRISVMPEFEPAEAFNLDYINDSFLERGFRRICSLSLQKSDNLPSKTLTPPQAIKLLQHLLLNIYKYNNLKSEFRKYLIKYTLQVQGNLKIIPDLRTDSGDARNHVNYLLQILHSVISGFVPLKENEENDPMISQHNETLYFLRKEILMEILIPLHLPNEMIVWRDQIPVIQLYHEDLCRCVIALLEKCKLKDLSSPTFSQGTLLTDIIKAILTNWPEGFNTNTPKQVLLLHELEFLIERCSDYEFSIIQSQFLNRFTQCIGTNADNIRPAQRALQFFKNTKVVGVIMSKNLKSRANPKYSIGQVTLMEILPSLYRSGQLSWNPTVNKMTALAFKSLMDFDESLFTEECNRYLSPSARSQSVAPPKSGQYGGDAMNPGIPRPEKKSRMLPPTAAPSAKGIPSEEKNAPNMSRFMTKLEKGSQPPVTITGVAPWAMGGGAVQHGGMGGVNPVSISSSSSSSSSSHRPNPPVTITGVAPWKLAPPAGALTSTIQDNNLAAEKDSDLLAMMEKEVSLDGKSIICGYMKRCYEEIFDESVNSSDRADAKEWNQSQNAMQPKLLPTLKFHDLVFGHFLGDGAFSTVKYARQITKGKPQSLWPEYAVKIIDAKKVAEHNYSLSVIREICILQSINHPNIARLISAFQYNQSAYLILEYAKNGDLHTFLINHGKLTDHYLIRFIIGEIAAGLHSLHELGFVYNDLKPENILITELGHIKITDFGACRPMNTNAKQILASHMNSLLFMRNGNWKDDDEKDELFQKTNLQKLFHADRIKEQFLQNTNEQCEGTAAYMPPETLSASDGYCSEGIYPMVDSWALGCVLYFCYYGKPPFYGDPAQVLDQMEVFFQQQRKLLHANNQHHHHHHEQQQQQQPVTETHRHHTVHFTSSSYHLSEFTSYQEIENQSCEEFIHLLLSENEHQRMSIEGILDHSYITKGYLLSFQEIIDEKFSSTRQQSEFLLNPRNLYQRTPPTWPTVDASLTGMNGNGADDKWARRQFSSLWAPMPAQYNLTGATTTPAAVAGGGGAGKGHSQPQDDLLLNLLLLKQSLPIVEEEDEFSNLNA